MNRRYFGGAALAAGLAGCGVLTPKHTVHFRMDAYATVRDRPFHGTSVFEIRWIDTGLMAMGALPKWAAYRRGDALVLDLGPDGLLFGLWESVPGINLAFTANEADYLPLLPRDDETARYDSGEVFEDFNKSTKVFTLPAMQYPAFIRFQDIRDLKSVQPVGTDNFSAIYGAGSSLGPLTLRVTQTPINRGIAQRLPFWKEVGWIPLNNGVPPYRQPLSANLKKFNFVIDGDTR